MLQKSRLFIGILRFEELIEFLARNSERRRHDGDWCEDGLIIRPHEEDKADVVENEEEKRFNSAVYIVYAQLDDIRIPAPKIAQKKCSNSCFAILSCSRVCRANDSLP
jgi:hypothetical protein